MSKTNGKLEKARQVINNLQADIVCYNEHCQNLRHKANRNRFQQMFNGRETELRAIVSHNRNKDVGKFQEGGTAMMVYSDLIQQFTRRSPDETTWVWDGGRTCCFAAPITQ